MGNKCCGETRKRKVSLSPGQKALETIKDAQRRYFNSHIENNNEDSDDDSVDGLFGSLDSLDSLDDLDGNAANANNGADNFMISIDGTSNGNVRVQKTSESKETVRKRRATRRLIRLSKRANFYSIWNDDDKKARNVDPSKYDYPFENIVFEGGGNKGLAYCGCVRLLEELNVWPQIKRLSGTSAGAMTAALLAVGYNSNDLEKFFSENLNKIFLDHRFGILSLLPNLLTSYGWNPGNRIYKWFGQRIEHKMGDADITFKQLHARTGRELCIVVTNLNQMTSLYCHPKTTPDMTVRLAVRMSLSIPGLFKAVTETVNGSSDVFVDGGVLCNYPIHSFDGWWLSMKSEDSFLEKLQPLEDIPRLLDRTERFGTFNQKTLGLQLYADNEQDLLKYQLENLRHGVQLQDLPNTKLAREKVKKKKMQLKTDREHRRLVKAMNAFLKSLKKHNADKNDNIDRQELEAALKDEGHFPLAQRRILFGNVCSDVILQYLDKDNNGQISYNELVKFMEDTGISMQNRFLGYQRRSIKNFGNFLDTLQATLLTNVKRVYVNESDLKRTVGINTGHVGTSDFVLEPADVEFIIERGRRSLEAFLKYYVAENHLKKKPRSRQLNVGHLADSKSSLDTINSNDVAASGELLCLSTPLETESSAYKDRNSKRIKKLSNSSGKSVHISDKVEVLGNDNEDKISDDSSNQESIAECSHYDSCDNENKDESHETPLLLDTSKITTRRRSSPLFMKSDSEREKTAHGTGKKKYSLSLKSPVKAEIHSSDEKDICPTSPLLENLCENNVFC